MKNLKIIIGLLLTSTIAYGAIQHGNQLIKGTLGVTGTTTLATVNSTQVNADNLRMDGNSITSENADGDITINPNGTGKVAFPDLPASRALVTDGSSKLGVSATTGTELALLNGLTGTVLTNANSVTVTTKTIDGDDNTLQDIGIASLKTVVGNANKVYTYNGSGVPTAAKVTATNMDSGASASGTVATADGAGNVAFQSLGAATAADTKNYMQNAEFRFWQRQTPGTLTSRQDAAYGPDRFYYLTSGGAVNVQGARVAEVIAASPTPYVAQFRQADGTARQYGVCQPLEYSRVIGLRGKDVAFSFYARTDGTEITTIRACIGEWAGTADSITRDVVSSWGATPTWIANFSCANTPADITISSTATRFTTTATLGSSFNNLIMCVWTPNTEAQNDDFYLTQMQLVQGSSAYSWPIIQKDYSKDFFEVIRFYEKSYPPDTAPASAAGDGKLMSGTVDAGGSTYIGASSVYRNIKFLASPTCTTYDLAGNSARISTVTGGGASQTNNVNGINQTYCYQTNIAYYLLPGIGNFAALQYTVESEM